MKNNYYKAAAILIALAGIDYTCFFCNAQTSTNLSPPSGFATRSDYINSFTNEDDALGAYRKGLIDRGEAMLAHFRITNLKSQDFYGKVIDQYGMPVTNADVTGNLVLENGWDIPEKFSQYKTYTDEVGLFQFTGLHGAKLGVVPNKLGYELGGHGEEYVKSVAETSSPTDRVTFIMWKLRGPEPMVHVQCDSRVPYNGASVSFDLASGKKSADGDLRITLSRYPLNIRRGRDKYDWNVKIEAVKGGLILQNDRYPNWAPEKGYQSSFEFSMSSNHVPWSGELDKEFYFYKANKQYGRLSVGLSTDSSRPDTGITIQTWLNPSGSQNLEFDPRMQIR